MRMLITDSDAIGLARILSRRNARRDPAAKILAAKLATARFVPGDDLPEDVASLDSRIAFRVNEGPVETRILVAGARKTIVGLTLPVETPRGAALFGLKAGEMVEAVRLDGTVERLALTEVLYQPERARRAFGGNSARAVPQQGFPMLVYSAPLQNRQTGTIVRHDGDRTSFAGREGQS